MPTSCFVPLCNGTGGYKFPLKNPERLKIWVNRVRRKDKEPNDSSRVCSKHFVETDYKLDEFGLRERKLLRDDAAPSVFKWKNPLTPQQQARQQRHRKRQCMPMVRASVERFGKNQVDEMTIDHKDIISYVDHEEIIAQIHTTKLHSEHCAQENISDHNYARSVDTQTDLSPGQFKSVYLIRHAERRSLSSDGPSSAAQLVQAERTEAALKLLRSQPNCTVENFSPGIKKIIVYNNVATMAVTAKMQSSDGQPNTRGLTYCCAPNCSRHARSIDSRTGKWVKMFTFPNPIRDQDRCAKWIANLKRADLKLENILTKKVCSAHFDIKSFVCQTNMAESRLLPSAIPTRFDSPKVPKTKLGKSSKKLQNINSDSNLVARPAKAKRGYVTEHSMPANTGTNKRKRRRTCADLDKVSANYGLHEGVPTATKEKYASGSEIRFKNLRSKRIGGFKCRHCKLIFTSRQEVDAHRQNDHKSQNRPIDAKTVECPDRQVLIKVSSDVKSLNAPVTKKVQEYSQLQLRDNCSGLNCLECRLPFGDAAHLRKYIICKLCRYATNCINAYQDHVRSYHTGAQKMKRARERPMGHDLHCACGFKSQFGDNVARHLVQCCKRTSYLMAYTRFLETEGGKPTPHILSMLGLIKQSGKKSPSEKSSGSHKWKRVKINDVSTPSKVSVFLGSCDSESNLDEQSLVPSSPSGVSDYSATVRSPAESITIHTCDPSVSATPMDDNVNQDLNDGSNHSHKSARVSPSSADEILSHKTCDSI